MPIKAQKTSATLKKIRLMNQANLNNLSLKMASEDWITVYLAEDVDEKVLAFLTLIIKMLDESLPEKTIRVHHSDKPWINGNIKMQIKARQRAFSHCDKQKYNDLCKSVANQSAIYYQSEASVWQTLNQSKWYDCIYSLVNAENTSQNQLTYSSESTDLLQLAEKLQTVFTKPWSDRYLNTM